MTATMLLSLLWSACASAAMVMPGASPNVLVTRTARTPPVLATVMLTDETADALVSDDENVDGASTAPRGKTKYRTGVAAKGVLSKLQRLPSTRELKLGSKYAQGRLTQVEAMLQDRDLPMISP